MFGETGVMHCQNIQLPVKLVIKGCLCIFAIWMAYRKSVCSLNNFHTHAYINIVPDERAKEPP